jgi:hypothetical protein
LQKIVRRVETFYLNALVDLARLPADDEAPVGKLRELRPIREAIEEARLALAQCEKQLLG